MKLLDLEISFWVIFYILPELLSSLLAELILAGESVPLCGSLVSAASRGDLVKVKEILESKPDKVEILLLWLLLAGLQSFFINCEFLRKTEVTPLSLSKGVEGRIFVYTFCFFTLCVWVCSRKKWIIPLAQG